MLSHYWSFLSCNFAGFHLTHPLLTIFGFSVGPTFVSGRAGQKNAQVPVIAHPCTFSITVFKPWYFYLLHFSFLLITVYLGSFGPTVFCLPSSSGECSRWLAQLMQTFSLGKKGGGRSFGMTSQPLWRSIAWGIFVGDSMSLTFRELGHCLFYFVLCSLVLYSILFSHLLKWS